MINGAAAVANACVNSNHHHHQASPRTSYPSQKRVTVLKAFKHPEILLAYRVPTNLECPCTKCGGQQTVCVLSFYALAFSVFAFLLPIVRVLPALFSCPYCTTSKSCGHRHT